MGFNIALHKEIAAPFLHQPQAAAGKRHIQLHFKGGRRQHGTANGRRIIVQPSAHQYRAHALRNHHHVLRRNAVGCLNMVNKILNIGHRSAQAGAVATLTRTHAVTAGIPGKIGHVVQTQLVGHKHHAPGMLMAAVKQQYGFIAAAVCRRAVAVKQGGAVLGGEGFLLFLHGALRWDGKDEWDFRQPLSHYERVASTSTVKQQSAATSPH